VLAAVGLVLTLAQARAWGQESLWTKAANLTCRIGNLPRAVIRKPRPAPQAPAPVFAWEKKDAAAWDFAVGSFLEIIQADECAYLHYKALSCRCPRKQVFLAAAERIKAKYEDYRLGYEALRSAYPNLEMNKDVGLDAVFSRWNPAEPQAPRALSSTALPCCDAKRSDGPINDDPLSLLGHEPELAHQILWASGFSVHQAMSPHPAAPATTAPILPEWTDILPDTECSELLIQLCVIDDLRKLLACPESWVSY
jgi:hypothetical protein